MQRGYRLLKEAREQGEMAIDKGYSYASEARRRAILARPQLISRTLRERATE